MNTKHSPQAPCPAWCITAGRHAGTADDQHVSETYRVPAHRGGDPDISLHLWSDVHQVLEESTPILEVEHRGGDDGFFELDPPQAAHLLQVLFALVSVMTDERHWLRTVEVKS